MRVVAVVTLALASLPTLTSAAAPLPWTQRMHRNLFGYKGPVWSGNCTDSSAGELHKFNKKVHSCDYAKKLYLCKRDVPTATKYCPVTCGLGCGMTCASRPCQNGGKCTIAAVRGKAHRKRSRKQAHTGMLRPFVCICASGFVGPTCAMTKADYVCEDNPKASQLVGMPCDLIPLVQCTHPRAKASLEKYCPKRCGVCTDMPTAAPTAVPTLAPTSPPTSSAPTAAPSAAPTVCVDRADSGLMSMPCTVITTAQCAFAGSKAMLAKNCPERCGLCTRGPTAAPTAAPTGSPTALPSASPTVCTDRADSGLMGLPCTVITTTQCKFAGSKAMLGKNCPERCGLCTRGPTALPTAAPTGGPTATPTVAPTTAAPTTRRQAMISGASACVDTADSGIVGMPCSAISKLQCAMPHAKMVLESNCPKTCGVCTAAPTTSTPTRSPTRKPTRKPTRTVLLWKFGAGGLSTPQQLKTAGWNTTRVGSYASCGARGFDPPSSWQQHRGNTSYHCGSAGSRFRFFDNHPDA